MTTVIDDAGALHRIEELQQQIDELRRQLAPTHHDEVPSEGSFQVLACRVGSDRVAFLHEPIEAVVMVAKLTPIPDAPHWVPGLLNLRGVMIPVIDVLARFTRQERAAALSDLIVITRVNGRRVGLVVQEVFGSYSCRADQLEPPPRDVFSSPFLLGVVHFATEPTLLLGLGSIVASPPLPEERA